jgi:hypothetical protein
VLIKLSLKNWKEPDWFLQLYDKTRTAQHWFFPFVFPPPPRNKTKCERFLKYNNKEYPLPENDQPPVKPKEVKQMEERPEERCLPHMSLTDTKFQEKAFMNESTTSSHCMCMHAVCKCRN